MNDNNNISKLQIPNLFHDSLSKAPFAKCQVCEKELIQSNSEYIIEKVFRKNTISNKMEILFEYAICYSCALNLTNSYSKESKENLQRYFMEAMHDKFEIAAQKQLNSEIDIYDQLSTCAITGKHVSELDEYQIVGRFKGGFIRKDELPFLIGSGSMDDVSDLLSNETLDNMDDFTGKYLTGPPEFRDYFKSPKRRPVLI
jgi:hypothetical protein